MHGLPEKIAALIRSECGASEDHSVANQDLIEAIIGTALRLVEEPYDRDDLKIIHAALKEMRYAFHLFSAYRTVRKVSVFGSARTVLSPEVYEQAESFGKAIVAAGFMVITGAGAGIMRAVQCGAGRDNSFGLNIRLPFEQEANEFIDHDPKLTTFKYFFTRKLFFVKEASAIVLFPGGFGTYDEGFEILTLLQTGKSSPIPVVMIDQPGGDYWIRWRAHVVEPLLARHLIDEEDIHLFRVVDRVGDAVEEITHFYRNYHSLRDVGDLRVIRLNHPLNDGALERLAERLNDRFADIILPGRLGSALRRSEPLPEEADEPDLCARPRLIFHSDKQHWGRLRQMIDAINDF